MRFITALLLALLPLTSAAELAEFSAKYSFERGRISVGETRMQLQRSNDNIWRYTSSAQATGVVAVFIKDILSEESLFRHEDGKFWPISYEYRHEGSKKNRDESIAYNWNDGVAHVEYRGHESDIDLEAGAMDRFLLQLAAMLDADGESFDKVYHVIDNGKVKPFRLQATGTETVTTPAGAFDTLRVERVDGDEDKKLRMWVAPAIGNLPVKIEQEKRNEETLRLVLEKYEIAGGE